MTENSPDLRTFTADEAELVEAFPLPNGVPDAILNKAQLAVGLDVSETTITAYLRKDPPLPSETSGTNGRSYQFRLSIAYAWIERMRANEDRTRAAGDAAANQMQLALLGGDSIGGTSGKLSLADQRKILELELQRTNAARLRGELVRHDDMVTWAEDMLATIRDAFDAFPDRVAREFGLDGKEIERLEVICDDVLAGAHSAVEGLVEDGERSTL